MNNNSCFLSKNARDILSRMSFMKRFNNEIHIHDENVAEHSFYVSFYSMAICDILGYKHNSPIRIGSIERALIHDIHETILSDIPHNVKESVENMSDICFSFEDHYNSKNFSNLIDFENSLNENKRSLILEIVNLADILSVVQYSNIELTFGNVKKFNEIMKNAEKRINESLDRLAKLAMKDNKYFNMNKITELDKMIKENENAEK